MFHYTCYPRHDLLAFSQRLSCSRKSYHWWQVGVRPWNIFATSPTTLRLGFFTVMMSKDCLVPIMSWSIALGWPASMSGGLQADAGPFLAWWSVAPSACLPSSSLHERTCRLLICSPPIIRSGATYGHSCGLARKLAANNSVSAKILLRIWPSWKLSFSSEVFRSAFFFPQLDMISSKLIIDYAVQKNHETSFDGCYFW